MDKAKQVDELINSLKDVMNDGIQKQNHEKAMAAISYGCNLLYQFNQKYMDPEFENGVVSIAEVYQKMHSDVLLDYQADSNTVLFYDGFGMDIRGVSKVNLNAIAKNGYRVIYAGRHGCNLGICRHEEVLCQMARGNPCRNFQVLSEGNVLLYDTI